VECCTGSREREGGEAMSTLIKTKGYDGEMLLIAKDKIVAMRRGKSERETILIMERDAEEWTVMEPMGDLRIKYDNA